MPGVGSVARREVGGMLIKLLNISAAADVDGIIASEVRAVSTLLNVSEEDSNRGCVVGRGETREDEVMGTSTLLELSAVSELAITSTALDVASDKGKDLLVVATWRISEDMASV
jgi:hypothetical protein